MEPRLISPIVSTDSYDPAPRGPSHPGRAIAQPTGVFRLRGYLGILVFGPLFAAAVFSGRYYVEGSVPDDMLDLLGMVLLMAGVIVRTWATLYVAGRKTRELVTSGPYSISRNPLYLGSLLIGLAMAGLLQSVTLFVAIVVLGPIIYLPVIRKEEEALARAHGAHFEEYCRMVPRFLPGFRRRVSTAPDLNVSVKGMRNHLSRTVFTLALFPLGELIATAQAHGYLPNLFHIP